VGKSFALIDGWKNQYILKRGTDSRVLDFDISPSLPHFSNTLIFSMTSMTLGTPGALEGLKEINEKLKPEKKTSWAAFLFWIVLGVIFILWKLLS